MKCEKCQEKITTRTPAQNRSLHLWFTLLAEELNASGHDMREVIRKEVDIPWTPYSIKEYLWKPCQEKQLGKKSTTQLTTKEIDQVFDTVNRIVGERTGVYVAFPSLEMMEWEEK